MADILSQDEVDVLLSAVADGDLDVDMDTATAAAINPMLTTYDFRRPERVSKEQLKGLQSLFEAFSREIGILLPPFLRTVVRLYRVPRLCLFWTWNLWTGARSWR
jgi:flagellar motor switch protein FliM